MDTLRIMRNKKGNPLPIGNRMNILFHVLRKIMDCMVLQSYNYDWVNQVKIIAERDDFMSMLLLLELLRQEECDKIIFKNRNTHYYDTFFMIMRSHGFKTFHFENIFNNEKYDLCQQYWPHHTAQGELKPNPEHLWDYDHPDTSIWILGYYNDLADQVPGCQFPRRQFRRWKEPIYC